MEKGLQNFGLREILEIILPGVYLVSFLLPFKEEIVTTSLNNTLINNVSFLILTLLVGIIFYWIDLPKKIPFFKNNLPTNKLINENADIDKTTLINSYFKFYDSLPKEQKSKTNTYTSLYHFNVNIFLASFILLLINLCTHNDAYNILILIILLTSLLNTLGLFFGKRKIRYMFNRQYNSFVYSHAFKNLKRK